MTNDPTMNTNGETGIPPNAVSLYGHNDAMDDFPVLKAFQQYIDAEQAKAQKRMTTMCIFFAIILSIVIGVFVLLLLNVGQRNQALNDQLLNYVMKDRDRQPVVVQNGAPANQDATVKMLTDSLAAMQKQLADQQTKMLEQQAKHFEERAKAAEEMAKRANNAPSVRPVVTKQQKKPADDEKLKKAMAELAAEKEKLAKEKEALRQQKIEMHRRKLYPEYYEKKEATQKPQQQPPKPQPKPRPQTQNTDDFVELIEDEMNVKSDGSIRYFSDDEEETKPVPQAKPPATSKVVTPPPPPPPSQSKAPSQPATLSPLPEKSISLASGWEIPLD